MLKIQTFGGKDLLASETFLAVGLGETVIYIGEKDPLCLVLDFAINKDEKEDRLEWNTINPKTLKVTLTNWNSVLGTSLVEPAAVGTYFNHQLFVMFAISKCGNDNQIREVTLSLYLGDEVKSSLARGLPHSGEVEG